MVKNIILDVGKVLVAWEPEDAMKKLGFDDKTVKVAPDSRSSPDLTHTFQFSKIIVWLGNYKSRYYQQTKKDACTFHSFIINQSVLIIFRITSCKSKRYGLPIK